MKDKDIELYGGTHTTHARDIVYRKDAEVTMDWDTRLGESERIVVDNPNGINAYFSEAMTAEQLYQAFKKRLMDEVVAEVEHNVLATHYPLVDKPGK